MIDRADSGLVHDLHPSPNIDERVCGAPPRLLILHYTGMKTCVRAIDWLSRRESKVSCHYVIDCDGRITQMVAETQRAWHAGVSYWQGITDVNSASIGIEIHNPGHDDGYPEFPEPQMRAVRDLGLDIVARWKIPAGGVLGHSDVAPARKMDPGEKFDWHWLAQAGVGTWVEPEPVGPLIGAVSDAMGADEIARAQRMMLAYGYGLAITGQNDKQSRTVVRAFQRHFRPARVDGLVDHSTIVTLERLLTDAGISKAEASDLQSSSMTVSS
ncbi:MAG: N-acetylmuramoyl-L-alanine amidase [Pseudomonadota bacterium]